MILIGRPYALPKSLGGGEIHYGCGQPMGALSSWAMLAVTHHFLVQYARFNVCLDRGYPYTPTRDYCILGDDLIITDISLAKAYLRLLKMLGMEVNLSKSIVSSNRTLEFAKRTFVLGRDVSPISLTEI